jgi:hypothetical protein
LEEKLLGNFLELLGAIGHVTEEEIDSNIEFFKEYEWFQNYLKDGRLNKLLLTYY